jgi:transcriptional regulator with GAF, ATPase, and Fis domain
MNIGLFVRPKGYLFLTTVFFTGIIISAGALYLLPCRLTAEEIRLTYTLVGGTFLAGIMALYLTAQSKKQTVVYLDRKKENTTTAQEANKASETQLNIDAVERIIETSEDVLQNSVNQICKQLNAGQGALYVGNQGNFELNCGYALSFEKNTKIVYTQGEGLVGRVAAEGRTLYIDKLPEGYLTIFSGLGASSPRFLVIVPIMHNNEVRGVLEIATFEPLNESTRKDLEKIGQGLAEVVQN